jgi:hypothetical protein
MPSSSRNVAVCHGSAADQRPLDLSRYVWTTGAVYAFAPSFKTLKALAEENLEDLGLR